MAIAINGSGTITGISQGGLNDNIITQSELANTGVAGNGPAFRAYMSAGQYLGSSTNTKMAFDTKDFDTASCYNTSTYRFTPNVAGYYIASANVYGQSGYYAAMLCFIMKNGVAYTTGGITYSTSGSYTNAPTCTGLIYMNGTTDYLEVYAYTDYGQTFQSGTGKTHFDAVLVRAA